MSTRKLAAALCLLVLLCGAAMASAQVTGLYYKEVDKDGRVYVFNTPERAQSFEQSGEIGTAITLIGKAEGGRTLVGENETAIDLYNFKHNLPAYDRATPKPAAPSKFPSTKIQGRFFGNFTNKENKDEGTGLKSSDSGTSLDVKRFYFTVTHQIDDVWSAQFQSDIGDQGAKRYDVFVKKAFVQAKINDAFTARLGSADTPWIPYAEGIYGMRYFEQTITDTLGFGTSADWGLHLLGKFADGKVSYAVSGLNGKGYSNPTRTGTMDFEGRLTFEPIKGLSLSGGYYSGKLGNDTASNSPALHTASRTNAIANWKGEKFWIGGEWFQAKNFKNVTTVPTDKADGYTIWARFIPAKDMAIFARYDQAKPSKQLAPDKKLTYYNLGFEKRFNAAVTANIAYKYAEAEGGVISVYGGNIGSLVPGAKGKYQEIGVWAQYDF